jgi:hypothetical protein
MRSSVLDRLNEISSIAARDRRLILAYRKDVSAVTNEPDKIGALIATVRALKEAGIRCALIGGVAVGIHSGSSRASVGVDFATEATIDRQRVIETLERAGLRKTGELLHSCNFRHRSGEPVQLAFDPSFDPFIARAERFDVEGTSVAIVRKDDLITMKQRAAEDPARRKSKRLRDQADVELLRGDVPDPDEGW